ncbi:MAG: hypothetical protein A3G32_03085 [Deltaproteobacteria bacterium RIFCSPLOWO2_12_FULL_40_28]|nr:MAG: hypothetical protein A3C45_01770 [Deltaproteobacteria bacterium RIFCSPHIGHO2_02_FULL_40_28]OGQ19502.1 MAG: hypothetical protein A3E27_02090 [Deltaproteobacteria bacterium RIFCSPHIGHO2_12_FULL_40_32]OGQ39976.1 MAG: hypothetical protein A3I69_08055 [Deltaproteobacteria bacterium RIFCSPLOWO2_02_FULL_40_36]OGQ54351.1 MAG: hypothetical protein A3G32_03085 [Deltaproteobacteria bacterium RIFCSPLOWO2_12_FULL_40_28]
MTIVFQREQHLDCFRLSAFLFGPRMTGKTTLLDKIKRNLTINLLDPEEELNYRQTPRLFWEKLKALPKKSVVVLDEVQRVPTLLDYVQMGIDQLGHRFFLSGSSARKLKRGSANLLGGRAINLRLHALSVQEIGNFFDISKALSFGTLPHIYKLIIQNQEKSARDYLKSYVTIYIKEEIQAEALTRNLAAFQRFLPVAAQSNAQIIEYANISRECSIPMSTVKEYYQILEDTLVGEFLWPYDRNERKKARPKFYFFDCGVVRALQNRLNDFPTPSEKGFLFENWFFRELVRIRDYTKKEDEIALWRSGIHEIDFIIKRKNKMIMAIECKTSQDIPSLSTRRAFHKQFPKTPLVVASLTDSHPRKMDDLTILPWMDVLDSYRMQSKT